MLNTTIERVRAYLRQPGVTKRQLAVAAGLHPNTLTGVDAETWNPTLSTLRALERQVQVCAVHGVGDSPPETDAAPGKISENSTPQEQVV